jgi:hypothetical protein
MSTGEEFVMESVHESLLAGACAGRRTAVVAIASKASRWTAWAVLFLAGAAGLYSQTTVDLTRQARLATGAVVPSQCVVGQIFFKTNAAPGANLYACTTPGVWTPVGIQTGGAATRPANCVLGQTWLAVDTGAWTYCSATGTWSAGLAGPPGLQGPAGAPGPIAGSNGQLTYNNAGTAAGSNLSQSPDGSLTAAKGFNAPACPVALTANPVFDASQCNTFTLGLGSTAVVTASSLTNAKAGQFLTFIVTQDAAGSRSLVWPPNLLRGCSISPSPGVSTILTAVYDGINANAIDCTTGDSATVISGPERAEVTTTALNTCALTFGTTHTISAFCNGSTRRHIMPFTSGAGDQLYYSDLLGIPSTFTPALHASTHQYGGSDEVSTATPGAYAIPQADSSGHLAAGWFPVLNQNTSGTAAGLTATYIDWNAVSGGAAIMNKPTLGTAASHATTDFQTPITTGSTSQYFRGDFSLAVFPSLAPVATSGSYADLSGKPVSVRSFNLCSAAGCDDSTTALTNAEVGPQGRIYMAGNACTVVEVTVAADAGTPAVILAKNHAGTITNLLSGALATGSAGIVACAATGSACLDGTAKSGTVTIVTAASANARAAGDWIETVSTGAAGSTAHRLSVAVVCQ